MRILLCVLLIAMQPALAAGQDRIYVDIDASEGGDGASWETAYHNLDDALLDAADQINTEVEIWVAEGTYITTEQEGGVKSFILPDGISLFGGFSGTEVAIEERDLDRSESVLSGKGIFLNGAGKHSVIIADSVSVTIDGFTITQGWNRSEGGGGIRAVASNLVLRHLTVTENEEWSSTEETGGGGMYLEASTAECIDVDFLNNTGGTSGGGLFARSSRVYMQNVAFEGNTTNNGVGFGGGLHARNSEVVIIESEFEENGFSAFTAPSHGGAIYSVDSRLTVLSSRFESNVVAGVAHSQIRGGAVYHRTGADASGSVMANVLFVGNEANGEYSGEARGGSIQAIGGPLVLINATIVANRVSAKFVEGYTGPSVVGPVVLLNSIIWGNAGTSPLEGATVANSLVQGGYDGNGILNTDPLFIDMPMPGESDGDLRLSPESPAIDAGLLIHLPPDTLDLDNDGDTGEALPLALDSGPRVLGSAVDLGAYEGATVITHVDSPLTSGFALRIYPNPFRGSLVVAAGLPEPGRVTIRFFDILGRAVDSFVLNIDSPGSYEVRWDASHLPPGMYLYRVESESNTTTGTLIKVQ